MIRILEKNVADKIAAGEVIDRPVSIVKELVENSLDAGAGSITVEIRNGGKTYLRVTDDGSGIPSDEAELAFRRHATSKISVEQDLDAIGTLGFRGEALASICAVSRTEMITKTRDAHTGRDLVIEGSELIRSRATGCPDGTTVTVQDLFYNVPARKKFLASDSAEARRIIDLMSRMALAYPDVRIRMINGKKNVFQTSGRGNILENILAIYGKDLQKDLLPVDASMNGCILRGFVSSPGLSSSSRNRQIFCVNGRIVSGKVLERGLEKAYKERLFTGRFPIAFLFLSVPPETLDVNIHPTKKEIRFDDGFLIEDFLEASVRKALMSGGSVPHAAGDSSGTILTASASDAVPEAASDAKAGQSPAEDPDGKTTAGHGTDDPAGQGAERPSGASGQGTDSGESFRATSAPSGSDGGEQVDITKLLTSMRKETVQEETSAYRAAMSADRRNGKDFDILSLQVIGVVLNTYIITTDGESMLLIDQHAAHERVFYERFLKQYHSADKIMQPMLIPLQYSVSADVEAAEEDWIGYVRDMGYEIEYFGSRTYLVRSIPAFMHEGESERFLRRFFIELEEKPDLSRFAELDRLIMRSCKSAIKGGDILHEEEVDSLLQQLAACGNPYSCPHGRPTFVRLSRYELEKMFKRA